MNDMDIQQFRQARLKAAVDFKSGGKTDVFGSLLGYRDGSYVRQMVLGLRSITEKTIRKIEALPGMAGWFVQEAKQKPRPGTDLTDEARMLAVQWMGLPVADRKRVVEFIEFLHFRNSMGAVPPRFSKSASNTPLVIGGKRRKT